MRRADYVLLAIEARTAKFPLVQVADLLKDTGLPPRDLRAALDRLYQQGAIELRPESGIRTLSAEVKDASPRGPRREVLTAIRLIGGKTLQPNPPWADKAILAAWHKVMRFAQTNSLPMPPASLRVTRKPTFREYGCGFFGCVYPTSDDSIVFKVSSDQDEVDFILRSATLGKKADLRGLVRYHAMLPIPGSLRKNDLAVIWRESAREAGGLANYVDKNKDLARFSGQLMQTTWFALGVKNAVKKHRDHAVEFLKSVEDWMKHVEEAIQPHLPRLMDWTKPQPEYWDSTRKLGDGYETAMNIGAYALVCEGLAQGGKSSELVGKTMSSLLRMGIVLADVHTGNVGMVEREGAERWVITDPGIQVLVNPMAPRITHKAWVK